MEQPLHLRILRDIAAVFVTFVFMFPILWWALTSIKPISAVFDKDRVVFFDFVPTLINYAVTLFGLSRSGIAIDQGLIKSVDDTAATYIRKLAGDERSRITIRQMLQQASGIDFPGFTGLLQMTLGGDVAPFTFSRGVMEPGGQRFE